MKIEAIIYETTKSIFNIEDKLRIATIFLFCFQLNAKTFAELLYTDNHELFIGKLGEHYKEYDIDLNVRLNDKNIRDCFYATLNKVKEKYDADRYYKALYENDPFAVVIDQLVNYNFDALTFRKITKSIGKQLEQRAGLPFLPRYSDGTAQINKNFNPQQ